MKMTAARHLRAFLGAILFCLCYANPAVVRAQDAAPLLSEGFESAFKNDDKGGPECAGNACLVPDGWGIWFVPRTPTDSPGINGAPKFEQTRTNGRFKGGQAALRYYTSLSTHTGGVYRIVQNVTPGARLRLNASGLVWSTNDQSPISARPSRGIRLKIGIDPSGGENGRASPFSSQIIWSEEKSDVDVFGDFSVEADARASSVIVFLFSTMKDPVAHNEVFWDDVSLSIAAQDVVTATAPTGPITDTTAAATPVPEPSPTVLTNDETYEVRSGDTLGGIALRNGITLEELNQLNPGVNPTTLQIGQTLIIRKGNAPAATVPPEATAAPADAILGAGATITGTPTVGQLCVSAFFDRDGDGKRAEQGEDLVPQIQFTVSRDGAPVGNYLSNGVEEPFCFPDVANGAYTVAATVPPVYITTSPLDDAINVRGARSDFLIGIRKPEDAGVDVSPTSTPVPAAAAVSPGRILSLLAVIGGVTMGIGLVGLLISSFLRQRRL
jgi:LysM repeat protein